MAERVSILEADPPKADEGEAAGKKVLIITYHFPPSSASGSFRMLGFARHLPRYGWDPIVVAPPSLPWEPVDRGLLGQVPPTTTVCPVPYSQTPLLKPVRKFAPFAIWLASAWGPCVRAVHVHRPHAMLTSGPPHWVHLLGLFLKRRFGIPWLADFRDPWATNNPYAPRGRLRTRWLGFWESAVVRNADTIIGNVPAACAGMQAAHPAHRHKMVPITNGYDPELFPEPGPRDPTSERLSIMHAGMVYAGRDPRPFLDALADESLPHRLGGPLPRVRFIGRAPARQTGFDLAAEVQKRGLEHCVTVEDQLPYRAALQAMIDADILLLLDSPGRRMGVPAKAYEYVGAGRPIFALAEEDGDLGWVIRESGVCHRIAPPTDAQRIGVALADLVLQVRTGAVPRPGQERQSRFTREASAQELARVLDHCTGAGAENPSKLAC
jgi:hypothetical protein